jgi:glycosyltransferase involved in cell wall biosynthesis
MRILMILENTFPPDVRVEKEIKSLDTAGHKIVLACSAPTSRDEIITWNGATIIRKKMSRFIYKSSIGCLRFPFYFNYWRKFLKYVFSKYEFDAIHLHDLPLAKVAKEFSVKHQIPFVLDLHENWPAAMKIAVHTNTFLGKILSSNRQWQNYERKMLFQADKVIAVVEEMKERISQPELDDKNIYILPNTINLNDISFEGSTAKNGHSTLFYAGGINFHRGLQIVLQALKEVKKEIPNILFNIVGSGSYEKVLKNYVRKNRLKGNVVFLGWKSYDEMMDILKKSDIALIPHLRSEQTDNSSPNKIFQYAFMKKPVICSDCRSLKRLISEMKSGVVYKDRNYKELSREIIRLSKDKKLRDKLGESGHEAVLNKYNWQKSSSELLRLYEELKD